MAVDLHGKGGGGMTQALLDYLGLNASTDQPSGMSVAQVMEAQAWVTPLSGQLLKVASQNRGVKWVPERPWEHQVIVVVGAFKLNLVEQLSASVLPEHSNGISVYGDPTPARCALGGLKHDALTLHPLGRLNYGHNAIVQIDVAPPDGHSFTTADTRKGHETVEGSVGRGLCQAQDVVDGVRFRDLNLISAYPGRIHCLADVPLDDSFAHGILESLGKDDVYMVSCTGGPTTSQDCRFKALYVARL